LQLVDNLTVYCVDTGEKEVWTSWLEYTVWVQLCWLECQCPILPESSWWNWS